MARLGPLMRDHAARAATLIPGARETFDQLRAAGLRVASSTGYTRDMMEPVLARAAEQGYVPEHVVCSGETPAGRPSPLMIYKACAELGVWPLSRVVKVDDAEVGIAEGKAAGVFTVGVASGNALGLSLEALQALPSSERASRIATARQTLLDAGPISSSIRSRPSFRSSNARHLDVLDGKACRDAAAKRGGMPAADLGEGKPAVSNRADMARP